MAVRRGIVVGQGSTSTVLAFLELTTAIDPISKDIPDRCVLDMLDLHWSANPGAVTVWLARASNGRFPASRRIDIAASGGAEPSVDDVSLVAVPTPRFYWGCGLRVGYVKSSDGISGKLWAAITTANAVTTTAVVTWSEQ